VDVLGIDFTSRPSAGKPIACARCAFDGRLLRFRASDRWSSYAPFEAALQRPGPWIVGLDFPFGQSRTFIETVGWPTDWRGYALYADSLGRTGFREALDTYRLSRAPGEREHRREADRRAGSISPQKLYGVPVGLMFFEGAPRLGRSGVTIPFLQEGDPDRVVVEAYPGVLARAVIGKRPYKQDTRKLQTKERRDARCEILKILSEGEARRIYGFEIEAPQSLCDDPSGDDLDAFLCAVQAAWASASRADNFGMPRDVDRLEGWIADPSLNTPPPASPAA